MRLLLCISGHERRLKAIKFLASTDKYDKVCIPSFVPFMMMASESDNDLKPTPLDGSSDCDPTPKQLEFLQSRVSGDYEDLVKRVHEIRKE